MAARNGSGPTGSSRSSRTEAWARSTAPCATTTRSFRKIVALKLVRGGRHSDYFQRRFRQERQILARLQRPNIATVLEGGTAEAGQPYLVMEHVEGQPITDFSRRGEQEPATAWSCSERYTNGELSKLLDRPINTVTPRVHELRKLGLVEDAGRRPYRVTHSMAHAWKLRRLASQLPPARPPAEPKQMQLLR
jgi:serine/threonine protein kinase